MRFDGETTLETDNCSPNAHAVYTPADGLYAAGCYQKL